MRLLLLSPLLVCFSFSASAQTVISAHSGTIHLAEGAVTMDGKSLVQKYGTFPEWKEKSELRTDAGRVEILLTPGVFLRVGENTALRMIDNRLSATRVELLSGRAVVESEDPMKENAVTLVYGGYEVQVRKSSVFALDSEPAQLKVYHGEAAVASRGDLVTVKSGRLLPLSPALAVEKFDAKDGDALTRWSQRRSGYIAAANMSSAKSLKDSGSGWASSSWYYNPYFSMYTYIPLRGTIWSPYGFGYFSPFSVYSYLPYQGGYGGGNSSYAGLNTASSYGTHAGDQSGSFGRNANSGLSSGAAVSSPGNAGGFGRGSSSLGSGAPSASPSAGTFSGGGNIGGGNRGAK